MSEYIEGSIYIVYVRKFGSPASDPNSHHVRARCIGGNSLDVGYFVDAAGNRFNSVMQHATLESKFVWNRDIVDVHPFPSRYSYKKSILNSKSCKTPYTKPPNKRLFCVWNTPERFYY